MAILITGGCGFIGSNYINSLLKSNRFNDDTFDYVINIDKLDYCSSENNVDSKYDTLNKYVFVKGSICDKELLEGLFK